MKPCKLIRKVVELKCLLSVMKAKSKQIIIRLLREIVFLLQINNSKKSHWNKIISGNDTHYPPLLRPIKRYYLPAHLPLLHPVLTAHIYLCNRLSKHSFCQSNNHFAGKNPTPPSSTLPSWCRPNERGIWQKDFPPLISNDRTIFIPPLSLLGLLHPPIHCLRHFQGAFRPRQTAQVWPQSAATPTMTVAGERKLIIVRFI